MPDWYDTRPREESRAFGYTLFGKWGIAIPEFDTLCVKTAFFHIMKIPLIPMHSFVLVGEGPRGLKIILPKVQIKSVLMAWIELPLFVMGFVGLVPIIGLVSGSVRDKGASSDWGSWIVPGLGVSALAVGAYWPIRWILRSRSSEELGGAIEPLRELVEWRQGNSARQRRLE